MNLKFKPMATCTSLYNSRLTNNNNNSFLK